MHIIIVDANILFSGILNVNGQIAKLVLNSRRYFLFHTTEFLWAEIQKHKAKLVEFSGLSPEEIDILIDRFSQHIAVVPEQVIPYEFWQRSAPLVRDIDTDDISYVALNEFLDGRLWTGDLKLSKGLASKGYLKCISTKELLEWKARLMTKARRAGS